MYSQNIGPQKITNETLQKLDEYIREKIPSGFAVRNKRHPLASLSFLSQIDASPLSSDVKHRAHLSLGTLGGGKWLLPDRLNTCHS